MLKQIDQMPGFLALTSDAVVEGAPYSELFHLKRGGLGDGETVCHEEQESGPTLVRARPMPVGSAEIIYENF